MGLAATAAGFRLRFGGSVALRLRSRRLSAYVSQRSKDDLGELAGRFLREVRFRKHQATQTKD